MRRYQYYCFRPSGHSYRWIKRILLALPGVILIALLCKSKIMCSNIIAHRMVKSICSKYKDGKSVGNLCHELCESQEVPLTCNVEKDYTFTGTARHTQAVFKFAKMTLAGTYPTYYDKQHNVIYPADEQFLNTIQRLVKSKFNISLDTTDAQKLSYLKYRPAQLNRYVELEDLLSLLVDNEYLALTLYENYNIFPKLLGSCGSLYAVQKMNSISGFWHLMTPYDSQEEWKKRISISLMMLDYITTLENSLAEPLVICHMKLSNFGVSNDFKKVMYLSLESVHPVSVANSMTGNRMMCKQHSDCDYMDCRSFCNLVREECEYGVVNNNLQMICEKIFLGWMMSGRMLIPGLLLGPQTPRYLVELLEKCANPSGEAGVPRAPATKEVRNRLYKFLKHLL